MTEASEHAKQATGQGKAAVKNAAKAAKAATEPVVETVVEEVVVVAEGVNGPIRDAMVEAAEATRHVKLASFANRLNGSNVRFLAPFGLIFVGSVTAQVVKHIRDERKAKVEVEVVEIVDVEIEVEPHSPEE